MTLVGILSDNSPLRAEIGHGPSLLIKDVLPASIVRLIWFTSSSLSSSSDKSSTMANSVSGSIVRMSSVSFSTNTNAPPCESIVLTLFLTGDNDVEARL